MSLLRESRTASVLLALVFLGGCAGWFGRSQPGEKPAPLPEFKAALGLQVLWRAGVGRAATSVFVPAVDQDAVYAAGENGQLARFDAETGRELWRVDTKRRLSSGVGAGEGLAVVGTGEGEVLAFDREGKPLWTARVSTEVLSAPRIADATVVVRSADGRIFGLEAATGKRKWIYQRQLPALTVRSHAGVTVTRGAVFAGFPGGRLVALALGTGAVGWDVAVAQPRGATELERIADITSEPVVIEGQVCAVAFQGRLACFDVRNGSPTWAKDVSSYAGMAMEPRTVYVTDERSHVLAFERQRGASLWKQDKLTARRVSRPLPLRGYVAAGDYQGYVHLMNSDDGAFAARVATDGSAIAAPPVAIPGGLLVQTVNGGLYALGTR